MLPPFFFGYGSLVNRATHDYPDAQAARVSGWRRCWQQTSLRKLAYLSVHEAPGCEIDGLIARVPARDWAALDVRERAYERVTLAPDCIAHNHPSDIRVQLYRVRPEVEAPLEHHPVLLSYIDTVVAGFHDLFGEAGVQRFFATTLGWDMPVIDDRAAPVYPRAVSPDVTTRALIDTALDTLTVRRIAPL